MPKLAKVGTFRKTAAAAAAATPKEAGEELSRGQRKRQQKREQYLQKEKMILASLKLKRQEEQKNQIDGMDAIRSALLDTVQVPEEDEKDEAPTSTAPLLKSNKSKQSLVQKEVAHLNLVRQHPAFQADPFATIREHLQNTMAQTAPQREKVNARQLKERNQKKEDKKALKKENASFKKKRPKKFKATRSKSRS